MKHKHIASFLLVLFLCVGILPVTAQAAQSISSGSGDYYDWTLTQDGTLTVTGSYTPDFDGILPPWSEYSDSVLRVNILGLSSIGKNAFRNFSALKEIYIDRYSSGFTIGAYAFAGCISLEQICFPHGTDIDEFAFSYCQDLKSISLNTSQGGYSGPCYITPFTAADNSFTGVNAVVYYPAGYLCSSKSGYGGTLTYQAAYSGRCGLTTDWSFDTETSTLTISGIGAPAKHFSGHSMPWAALYDQIKSIVVAQGITQIHSYCFEYAAEAETVILPSTLETLACNAFNDCGKLNNLLLPASLVSFESDCYFNRCSSLSDIYYLGTEEEWASLENNSAATAYQSGNGQITLHLLQPQKGVPATCTEDGIEDYYQFGNDSFYPDLYSLNKQKISAPIVIPSPGHDYDSTVTKPTCTAGGFTTYVCSVCDDTHQDSFTNAAGHKEVIIPAIEADCIQPGFTESVYCTVCDEFLKGPEAVSSLGHDPGNWYVVTEAACETDGLEQRDCSRCSHSETQTIAAPGHTQAAISAVDATCTESGLTEGVYCSVCEGILMQQEEIPSLGHDLGDWYVVTKSTCEIDGLEQRDCSRCSHSETQTIAAPGHTEAAIPGTDATCTETGLTEGIYCSVCDAVLTQQEPLSATGHQFTNGLCQYCGLCFGDLNADGTVDDADVALLLWHTLFPDDYGISGNADFNADGAVDDADVAYLLWHTLFPDSYPLN